MSIPLIQDNQKDSINASLIAIKREEERLQALITEADKKIAQLNELKVNKSDIVDEVTLNNMQSVTSNAVYESLNTIETYTGISGLTLYKIGHLVFGSFRQNVTSSSPYIAGTLPEIWRPKNDYRHFFMNNTNDTYYGQVIIYENGQMAFYKSAGGSFSSIVVVTSFCYMSV